MARAVTLREPWGCAGCVGCVERCAECAEPPDDGRASGSMAENEDGELDRTDQNPILRIFDDHCFRIGRLAASRRARMSLHIITRDGEGGDDVAEGATGADCVSFVRHPSDRFIGDARLRAVNALLSEVDLRGFERSNHQELFHDAFIRSCGRVLYREEWDVHRHAIMKSNQWEKTPSEIMISTPRYAPA